MRQLLLAALLVAIAGTGLDCRSPEDYTVLVGREDSLFVLAGSYVGERCALRSGDGVRAEFSVLQSGGRVDFLMLSDSNMTEWEASRSYSSVFEFADTTSGMTVATVLGDGNYWIVVSNRDDGSTPRKVAYEVYRRKR